MSRSTILQLCQDGSSYLKWPLKIDKTKVLTTNGSIMKVESTAECCLGAFCNTFDLHKAITNFGLF